MREAAWKAVHGLREERSGVFKATPAVAPAPARSPRKAKAPA